MDEAKHTPGPWLADGTPENIHILQEACGHIRICFLTSDGPTEANAALIAAAPELLAALKKIVADADKSERHGWTLHPMYDEAREAIAKAEAA